MPRLDEVFARVALSGLRYLSKFDLKGGYPQCPLIEDDKRKTAFATPLGRYEYQTVMQGLRNAPEAFQAYMRDTLLATGEF